MNEPWQHNCSFADMTTRMIHNCHGVRGANSSHIQCRWGGSAITMISSPPCDGQSSNWRAVVNEEGTTLSGAGDCEMILFMADFNVQFYCQQSPKLSSNHNIRPLSVDQYNDMIWKNMLSLFHICCGAVLVWQCTSGIGSWWDWHAGLVSYHTITIVR